MAEPNLFQASPFAEEYPLSKEHVVAQQVRIRKGQHSTFQIRNSSSSSRFVLSLHVFVPLTVQIGLDRMERRGYGAATWTTSSRFLFENIALIFPRQAKRCVLTCSM